LRGRRFDSSGLPRPANPARGRVDQSISFLSTSHFWIIPAISSEFLSIIIMCELPLMPASGRSTSVKSPPAALKASAASRHRLGGRHVAR
jgi:hypothetical protein